MNQDNELKMLEELGAFYYQRAVQKFESGEYEEAVKHFIKVYEMGLNQEEIVELLYACFITPNEEEFKENYAASADGITNFTYEDTELDFIPVSEDCYYLYNKKEKCFCGSFQLEDFDEREKNFHSLLVADVWDVRGLLQSFKKTEYKTIYYLLNEQKSKFYSFLKLPKFAKIYLDNALCFESTEIMQMFFREYSDFYLPKTITGENVEVYSEILSKIHEARKRDCSIERKNVFLSICIPSYNRGHLAVEHVKQMLLLNYDSEIEIVVSDNGSTENVEGYCELANIQDSRLKYVRFDENRGYAANVLHVLEHASGQFAMLASDEDMLILENVGQLLNMLCRNIDKGVINVAGYGGNFIRPEQIEEEVIIAGMNAVWKGMNTNFITGNVFNMDVVRRYCVLERCRELKDNLYVQLYVHMAIALQIGKYANHYQSALPVWREGDVCGVGGFSEKGKKLFHYMTLESRIAQHETGMQLVEIFYPKGTEIYEWFFVMYLRKTYYLLSIARSLKREEFEQRYTWSDVCESVHQYSMQQLQEGKISAKVESVIKTLYEQYYRE